MFRPTVGIAALALASCGSPESFAEISPDIQRARATGPNLVLKARQEMVADSLAMSQLGMLVEEIAQAVQDGVPGPTEETRFVQLQLGYASLDRLGNEGTVDFGTIRFPIADLRAAKLDNLAGDQLLELADQASPGPAFDVAIEYCADIANFQLSPRWCGAVVAGAVGIAPIGEEP